MMEDKYALELIEKGKRIDGRKFDEFRNIEIEENVAKKAEGSASVKLGKTHVIVGVKLNIGKPFDDRPNEGMLVVNAEFSPLASPDFESGPPGEDAIELARVVDRGIRESKCIKLEELVIEPGEKVWSVYVDIHIINHHGNLLNAAALASLIALMNTKIPKLEEEKIIRGDYERDLPIAHYPINVTVCKVGNKYLIDPVIEEENVIDAKLSIGIMEDDCICAMQKQGKEGIELDEIGKMIDLAIEKSRELRDLTKWQ
jgi:exosome complex component RRP42